MRKIKFAIIVFLLMVFVCNCYSQTNDLKEMGYNGNIESIVETRYEKNGDLRIDDGKLIYRFNNKGNILEECFYESDGDLSYRTIYIYNENDDKKLEQLKTFSDGNTIISDYKYTYDEKGNLLEERLCDLYGRKIAEKKYDEKGNMLEEIKYLMGYAYNINKCTYDEKGNKLEECRYLNDRLFSKNKYTYNDKGNKLEGEGCRYDSDGELEYILKYIYDDKGNKLETRYFINEVEEEPSSIWIYEIIYR